MSLASLVCLMVPGISESQIYVAADIGGIPAVSSAVLENFDEPLPPILTLSGTAYLLTGSDGTATQPYFSGSTAGFFDESPANGYDNSPYVAVEPGGSATITFSAPEHYFGLLWGSIDPYAGMNTLTFYDSANNVIGTVDGGTVLSVNGSISPGATAYVNIISTTAFSRVVATATPIFPESFEFDDVAYAQAVPEPAPGAVFGLGLCLFAFVPRRKLGQSTVVSGGYRARVAARAGARRLEE
jgi:hypothetical protein